MSSTIDHYMHYAREEMKAGNLGAGFVGKAIAHTFEDTPAPKVQEVRTLIRDWKEHALAWEPTEDDLRVETFAGEDTTRAAIYRRQARFLMAHEIPAFTRMHGRG